MYKKIKYIVVCAIVLTVIGAPVVAESGLSLGVVPHAYAAGCDPDDENCTDPALSCSPDDSDPDCDLVAKYINPMITFLTIFVGIAVTVGIVYGAIEYTSAGSDPGKVQKARNHIRNSIIALIVFLFLWALINWLLPGGVVGQTSSIPSQPPPTSVGGNPPTTPPAANPAPTIATLNGVENFRDAGASGYLKTGILYRSAKLQTAVPSQVSTLLGGGTIIDLRTPSVINKSPDVSVPGVRAVNTPINGTEDYTEFVTSSASREGFKDAITAIANANGKVLIHCTYGKDRTGWTVAMIMYALGASDSQVMTEYLKSPDVSRDMLNAGLSQVRKDYGSIENYLYEGLGLSAQTVDKLEQKLR